MSLLDQAKSFHNLNKITFEKALPDLTPTEVLMTEAYVEEGAPGDFAIGDIRKRDGQVWECSQPHNNANNPDIKPGKSDAHWFAYHSKSAEYAKPFVQPKGAHDAYQKGEYMVYTNGKTYMSKIDANTWTPEDYPAGWEVVG